MAAIADSLDALGLAAGGHVLLDNCGTRLARSTTLSSCDLVVLERDWRLEMSLDDAEHMDVRDGRSSEFTFPTDAFHISVVTCDPMDPAGSITGASHGLAEGGVMLATAPASLLDGDGSSVVGALAGLEPDSVTRVSSPDGPLDVIVAHRIADGAHGDLDPERRRDLTDLDAPDLRQALASSLRGDLAMLGEGPISQRVQAPSPAIALPMPSPSDALSYELDTDGGIWLCDLHGVAENVAAAGTRKALRMRGAIELSGLVGELLSFESSADATEAEVTSRIGQLSERYHAYVAAFGRLSDNNVMREVSVMTHVGYLLQHLETVDEHGRFRDEGPILSERVSWPLAEGPVHVAEADTALSMSLAQLGRVDVEAIASLLDTDEEDALRQLGDRVIEDPDDGSYVNAEDYLSGNLGSKLDHVRELIEALTSGVDATALDAWHLRMGLEPQAARAGSSRWWSSDFFSSDAWSFLTGESDVVAVDVEAQISTSRVLRSRGDARDLFIRLLHEARPGAWDPVLAQSAREGFRHVMSRAIAWSAWQMDPYELLMDLSRCEALDEELLVDTLASLLGLHGSDHLDAIETLLELAGVEQSHSPVRRVRAEQAAATMRKRPDIVEWMLYCHRNRHGEQMRDRDLVDAFSRRREESLYAERNEERLAKLRDLEQRLVAALPARIERKDIAARLGSPWIPPSVYLDFARERLFDPDGSTHARGDVSFTLDPELRNWDVKYNDRIVTEEAVARYAIVDNDANDASAFRILSNAMRGTATVITRTVLEGDHTRQVTDEELTLLAADKRATLEGDFVTWLWSDQARSDALVERYNTIMNRHVGRSFDGSYLTFPGSSDEVELQAHQRAAVARVLRSPEGSLLAHAVGAGKTFEGIAAAHEAKRLGKCAKPLVAVPNSVVGQWSREWSRVYPHDRVLVMDDRVGRNAQSRSRFWDVARSGMWDAVIVPQSQFDLLRLSPEARLATIDGEIARYEELLRTNPGPATTARRRASVLQSTLRALRRERESLADLTGPFFDDMGFDMLIVDEAHRYKHLGVRTSMSVAGIDPKPSNMSQNLMRLCDYLRSEGRGSNIVFLTGTPVTNSVAELYVMQSYLAPKALDELGVASFDAWAATFGQVHREVEIKPEGGLQTKDRFSRFTNLPELMSMVHGWCDLVTNDDLELELPDVRVVNVEVPPTAEQRLCMRWLEGRGDEIRHNHVRQTDDNMLLITNDGKKVALDPKLLFPDDDAVPPLSGGKVDRCADNVFDVWLRTTTSPDGEEVRGTQLVFCDTSTDNGTTWNVQADLRRRLIERGIPASEVVTVPGSLSATQRERIYAKARSGEVRVLIGSTQTLGTGVSVQERLAATHDLDCPWRASDIDQRMGRIRRQGNSFSSCEWFQPMAFRYATVGTFDAYLYQTTARKGAFVSQVMTNDSPLREAAEISDVVLSLSEMKALASGNPAVRRRLELDNEVKSLQYRRSAWSREIDSAKSRLEKDVRPMVAQLGHELEGADALLEGLRALDGQRVEVGEANYVSLGISVGGRAFGTDKESVGEANIALDEAFKRARYGNDLADVAQVGPIRVGVVWRSASPSELATPRISITCDGGATINTTLPVRPANVAVPHVGGPAAQLLTLIDDAEQIIVRKQRVFARLKGEQDELVARTTNPTWPLEEELGRKLAELEALPVDAQGAISAAQQHPHISDVYAMLTTGSVVDLGERPRLREPDEPAAELAGRARVMALP